MSIQRFPFRSLYATLKKQAIEEQAPLESRVHYLKLVEIFFQLTNTQLELIADICEERVFHMNEVIFLVGSDSDDLYVIIQGEVDILIDPALVTEKPENSQAPISIANLGRGQSFGEIALVDRELRSATAIASQDNTRMLVIPRLQLMEICVEFPQIGYRLMKNLAANLAFKLRSTDTHMHEELLETRKS